MAKKRRELPDVVRFGKVLPVPTEDDPLKYAELYKLFIQTEKDYRRLGGLLGLGRPKYERRAKRAHEKSPQPVGSCGRSALNLIRSSARDMKQRGRTLSVLRSMDATQASWLLVGLSELLEIICAGAVVKWKETEDDDTGKTEG